MSVHRLPLFALLSSILLLALPAAAQDDMPIETAAPQHQWLQQMVGDWTVEASMLMGPESTEHMTGTETIRALGDLWIISEGNGQIPGGGAVRSVMQLGFDPQSGQFVGTFIASVMTHLWVYERGWLSEDGTTLTLEAEGPSFTDPSSMALYRDVIECVSSDHRILRSQVQGEDGEWLEFMEAHYYRQ